MLDCIRETNLTKDLNDRTQPFIVSILVLEGKYYVWPNMDSAVTVQVFGKRKTTSTVYKTDGPYYNEFLTFEKTATLKEILKSNITFTVFQPRFLYKPRKVLGVFKLDIATLWAEPNHQFYRKWAILSAPLDKFSPEARGYLRVNINLIARNISPIIPILKIDDDIERNLLLPHSKIPGRFRAKFEFDIYRAENLHDGRKPPSNCHIRISFSGNSCETTTRKNDSNPRFHEKIVIRDLLPPLCQRFQISVHFGSKLHAQEDLPLNYLTSDEEEGYLPMFGPSFLHFYKDDGELEEYCCRLLLALNTKLANNNFDERKFRSAGLPATPFSEKDLAKVDLKLFCILFDCSALGSQFSGRATVKLTMGETENSSDRIKIVRINRNSSYMKFGEKKPLLSLDFHGYDVRKKLHKMNILDKLATRLEERLEEIGGLFEKDDIVLRGKIMEKLSNCVAFFNYSARKYVDIVENYDKMTFTDIEMNRMRDHIKIMEQLVDKSRKIFDPNALKKTYLRLGRLTDRLFCLIENVNDGWPDVLISIWMNNRKMAYARMPSRKFLTSYLEEERGAHCGKTITIFLQSKKIANWDVKYMTNVVGKIEACLWLGPQEESEEFLKNLPGKFVESRAEENSQFRYVSCGEVHYFQCRCHIFQGQIRTGFDTSSLSDPMIRIHFAEDCQESTIEKTTVDPVWNQTLIFRKFAVYGDKNYIRTNPPTIFIEALDRDVMFLWELIGKNSVKPLVKFKDEPYAPPRFPPKLEWVKIHKDNIVQAEILAAFEMLEISSEDNLEEEQVEKDIIRIPQDIAPKLVGYRMDALFWGVRNLKNLTALPLYNPGITIECSKTILESETIRNVVTHANFEEMTKSVELFLPSSFEIASPIFIKLTNNQRLRISISAGIFIKHLKFFHFHTITRQRRMDIINGRVKYENVISEASSEDSIQSVTEHMKVFRPEHCLCKTSEMLLLMKKTSQIRCLCKRTRLQKIRQLIRRDKVICPCRKEHKEKVDNLEKKHGRTCPCCRKILEKLRLAIGKVENLSIWSVIRSDVRGKCECCRRLSKRIKKICLEPFEKCLNCLRILKRKVHPKFYDDYHNSDYDWWTKYYASRSEENPTISQKEQQSFEPHTFKASHKLKIYNRELESEVKLFGKFEDVLVNFPMFKGKRTGDEIVDNEKVHGNFKGSIKIYRWPMNKNETYVNPAGFDLTDGYFCDYPSNKTTRFLLRAYVIRALNLTPKDINRKCDPYLVLKLGNRVIDDRINYKTRVLNPMFGRRFEFSGQFPNDHTLTVQVWDRDVVTKDDFVGETRIDIENRLYTNHKANCGLPKFYHTDGYCAWRDQQKPSTILEGLCTKNNLPKPDYMATSVRVCSKYFEAPYYISSGDEETDRESKALYALRNWHEVPYVGCRLVPEHVETRSLYNPDQPLMEQGKIQLWLDIFPTNESLLPPKPVDISLHPPQSYELRLIIWNTADVVLSEDDFWTNQKKNDIFIKGKLLGHEENDQQTDVHYRSLTGEGMFNFRMIWNFDYSKNEEKTVVMKKETITEAHHSVLKYPCRITLELWDNDTLSANDFLGNLTFKLYNMPRGAKSAEDCKLNVMEPSAPHVNLFTQKRLRGWWPLKARGPDGKLFTIGKIDLEFDLLTKGEAAKSPAGKGRKPPLRLPEPKRPHSSFNFILNPLKGLRHFVWRGYRFCVLKYCCLLFVAMFVLLGVYSVPGYLVKRLLNA